MIAASTPMSRAACAVRTMPVKVAVKGKNVERQIDLSARRMRQRNSLLKLLFVKIPCLCAQAVLFRATINGVCTEAQRRLKRPSCCPQARAEKALFSSCPPLIESAAPVVFLPQRAITSPPAALCSSSVLEKASSPGSRVGRAEIQILLRHILLVRIQRRDNRVHRRVADRADRSPLRVYVLYAELTESSLSPSTIFPIRSRI